MENLLSNINSECGKNLAKVSKKFWNWLNYIKCNLESLFWNKMFCSIYIWHKIHWKHHPLCYLAFHRFGECDILFILTTHVHQFYNEISSTSIFIFDYFFLAFSYLSRLTLNVLVSFRKKIEIIFDKYVTSHCKGSK